MGPRFRLGAFQNPSLPLFAASYYKTSAIKIAAKGLRPPSRLKPTPNPHSEFPGGTPLAATKVAEYLSSPVSIFLLYSLLIEHLYEERGR